MTRTPKAPHLSGLNIRTFHPADAAVLPRKDDLFSSDGTYGVFDQGLLDFAMGFEEPISTGSIHGMREYIRHSLADDLADISASYFNEPGGHFWVAEIDGQVKGMVGIQRRTRDEAELRRMSVAADCRRRGIGGRLLETTQAFCREQGYRHIRLTTVSLLQPAIALYRKYGYHQVGEERYGQITGLHFVKHLASGL